jgi:hypothetical protein
MIDILPTSTEQIELVAISPDGTWVPRLPDEDENTSLESTLLRALYPESQVARLSLQLESLDEEQLEAVRLGFFYKGVRYLPVGTRKSAGEGKVFLVDHATHHKIAERFQSCGDALISYFDFLVSPCTALIQETHLRVLVVPNALLGSHDWLGSIRQSVFSKCGLPSDAFYEFAMTFYKTQAKGELEVMDDFVADRHGADVLLPKRAVKPFFNSMPLMFQGRVVLGINKVGPDFSDSTRDARPPENVVFRLLDEHVCSRTCGAEVSRAVDHLISTQWREQRVAALHA